MRTTETIELGAAASAVFPHVAVLDAYPAWLPLVHSAVPDPPHVDDTGPAWIVELRAKVGPFARSKRLRMVRTEYRPELLATFERHETDSRKHAAWILRAELTAVADARTRLTMHLRYDGSLWTGGLLDRVLAEQVERGRAGLARLTEQR